MGNKQQRLAIVRIGARGDDLAYERGGLDAIQYAGQKRLRVAAFAWTAVKYEDAHQPSPASGPRVDGRTGRSGPGATMRATSSTGFLRPSATMARKRR